MISEKWQSILNQLNKTQAEPFSASSTYREWLRQAIAEIDRLDEMEYKLEQCQDYMNRIASLPNCNTCAKKWGCIYCPGPGQNTRINCLLWQKRGVDWFTTPETAQAECNRRNAEKRGKIMKPKLELTEKQFEEGVFVIHFDLTRLKEVFDVVIVEPPKPKRWRAERGELYWFVDSAGQTNSRWDLNAKLDDAHYNSQNYFKTKTEAEKFAVKWRELFSGNEDYGYRTVESEGDE